MYYDLAIFSKNKKRRTFSFVLGKMKEHQMCWTPKDVRQFEVQPIFTNHDKKQERILLFVLIFIVVYRILSLILWLSVF